MIVVILVVSAIPVVILMIPVAFMHPPAFTIVIVMRMAPIRPFVGRTVPMPCHPPVVTPIRCPVPLDPNVARTRNRPSPLVPQRRWCASDVLGNLCRSRDGENDCEHYSAYPIQFHSGFSRVLGFKLRNPFGELPPPPPSPAALFTSWYRYPPPP